MSASVFERNLFALMRVNEPLARAMIDYGGQESSDLEIEAIEWPQSSEGTRLYLAGLVEPSQLGQWCDQGGSITVYCDRLDELMVYLQERDLRSHLFSGALELSLGVWRFALLKPTDTGELISTSGYHRSAVWARRASQIADQAAVIIADGGLFVDDVGQAFVELGYRPSLVNIEDLPTELWPRQTEIAPDFVFSINDRRGIEFFAESLDAKCLVWQIDPDLNEERPNFPKNLFVGWYKPLQATTEQRRYLPLAANPSRRRAREESCSGVSFVGSSMKMTGEAYHLCFIEYLASLGVDAGEAHSRVSAFRDEICLEKSRYSRELVLEVFPELGDGIKRSSNQDLGIDSTIWLGEYLAWQWRVCVIQNLSVPIQLWGDDGWQELTCERVSFQGRCGHGEELSRVYGRSRINLDIGRVYQEEIVTMRVFDVLASKRFILTPHTPALTELFDVGREIETYRNLTELQSKIHYYLAHPDKADEIALLGYERVLKDHRIVQRVAELVRWTSISV